MNISCLLRTAKTLSCKYNSFALTADWWIHTPFITDMVHLQNMLCFGYAVRCSVESLPTIPANVIRPLKMSLFCCVTRCIMKSNCCQGRRTITVPCKCNVHQWSRTSHKLQTHQNICQNDEIPGLLNPLASGFAWQEATIMYDILVAGHLNFCAWFTNTVNI